MAHVKVFKGFSGGAVLYVLVFHFVSFFSFARWWGLQQNKWNIHVLSEASLLHDLNEEMVKNEGL
jgi:hypothetical protein